MHLQTSLDNRALWQRLSADPSLSRQITSLTIKQTKNKLHCRDVPADIIPPELQIPENESRAKELIAAPLCEDATPEEREKWMSRTIEAEESLIHALKGMVGPKEFKWDSYPPLLSNSHHPSSQGLDIWHALSRAASSSLEKLQVLDTAEFSGIREMTEETERLAGLFGESSDVLWRKRMPVHDGSLFEQSFPRLKEFKYRSYSFKHGIVDPPTARLATFLSHCPKLEILKLDILLHGSRFDAASPSWSSDATPILSHTFPSLRSLRVTDMRCSAATLANFLQRHEVTLECVASAYTSVESGFEDALGQGEMRKWEKKGALKRWGVEGVEGPDGVEKWKR